MLAVSKSVTPRSIPLSTTPFVSASSIRIPKLLQPSPVTDTCRPDLPSDLYSMTGLLLCSSCRGAACCAPTVGGLPSFVLQPIPQGPARRLVSQIIPRDVVGAKP